MNPIKSFLIHFFLIAFVFLLYLVIKPMGRGYVDISKDQYRLKTFNHCESDDCPKFIKLSPSVFKIGTSAKKLAHGKFEMIESGRIRLNFSLKEGENSKK